MRNHPDPLPDRPVRDDDPLTDILTLASARCAISASLVGGGSWALRFPPPARIKFIAIAKGACWLLVDGEPAPVRLRTGDVVMLPSERCFELAGDLNAPRGDGARIFADAPGDVARVGSGEDFVALGGHMELDVSRGDLLAGALPPVVHVDGGSPEAGAMRWLLEQLLREGAATRPGAALATRQLAQLLFVQVIRAYLAAAGPLTVGWMNALVDDRIAPALRMMHREPGRGWRLEELAKAVHMSRSQFALRFKAAAGVAPLTYLQQWRMRLAEQGLREGSASVSELGRTLGYASESAFSNAFKRRMGMSPTAYRSRFADGERPAARPPVRISVVG